MPSAPQQAAIAAIIVVRNWAINGVAVNGAAIEGIEALAPTGDVVSGPQALLSAVQVCGWQAQYAQALGYYQRALTNARLGSI